MRNAVINYIKEHNMLNKGDGVLVGVSGGPDSVCLLHILKSLEESYGLRIFAVHINHMLRGESADGDEAYIHKLCDQWNIPCIIKRIDIKELSRQRGISIEEAGREARYQAFFQIKEEKNLQKIALGQHRDDNGETVLMRIIRGTGPKGLAGIAPHRKDGVIRPLLDSSRKEIEKYCMKNNLTPRIDHTNLETIYFRNKLRLEIIPLLEELNGNFKSNLHTMSQIIREEQEYIEEEVEKLWEKNVENRGNMILMSLRWVLNLPIFMQKQILRKGIFGIKGNLKEIESNHIKLIIEKMKEKKSTTWTLHLPEEIRIERQYEKLIIRKQRERKSVSFTYPIAVGETLWIPQINKSLRSYFAKIEEVDIIKDALYKKYFDWDKIKGSMVIRNRRPGDRFYPLGLEGSKKLKDYFIDLKVPKDKRGEVPIISQDNEILWVVGYRKDRRFEIEDQTKNILVIECKNEEDKNGEGCKRSID